AVHVDPGTPYATHRAIRNPGTPYTIPSRFALGETPPPQPWGAPPQTCRNRLGYVPFQRWQQAISELVGAPPELGRRLDPQADSARSIAEGISEIRGHHTQLGLTIVSPPQGGFFFSRRALQGPP